MEEQRSPAGNRLPYHLIQICPRNKLLVVVAGSTFSIFNLSTKLFLQLEGDSDSHHSDLIRGVAWNRSGNFLATASDDKVVKLWRVGEESTYSFSGQTPKNSKKLTSVIFSVDSGENESVIYADKFGEVFSSLVSNIGAEPKVLLGHVSILTEVLLSPAGDLLLSADRDEKIRVSQYPKAYNIEAYCLGHTEFVSRICIPSQHPTLLFSGSGDGTVRIWRYTSGELLHTENFKRDDTHIVTLPVAFSDKKNILVVLVEDSPVVHLLKLEGSTLKEVQILPLRASPYDAVFDAEDNLWVSTSNGVEAFSVGIDDTYSPNEYALGSAVTMLNQKREQQTQAPALSDVDAVVHALSYASMRKRIHNKDKTKKRRTEEGDGGATSSKLSRKERRQRAKQQAAAKKAKQNAEAPQDTPDKAE